jgi:PmbA protein
MLARMTETDIISLLETALSDANAAGATSADAVHIDGTDISVSQRLGNPEDMERAESAGVGIRAFVGGKYAMASSSDLSREALKLAAERAVAMAKASIEDAHSRMAEAGEWGALKEGLELYEAEEPSIEWMREQCAICEDAARSHAGITNSEGAQMSAGRHAVTLVSSVGKSASYASSSVSLSASVLGGEGEGMERDYAYSVARHSHDLRDAADIGNEAAKRTLKRLNPRKQTTQTVPVLFDPRVSKGLLGSFTSAISGSAVARGTSFLKDKMGEQLFADSVQIIDDPHRVRGLASRPLDSEGLANAPLELVKDGVLQTWLLDLRSASQLGLKSNARASRGLGSPPSPSSTNVHLAAGDQSPEAMISEIESGFYVTEAFGMGVNLVTGDYSQGASGFWIEKGELAYPVSELTIAGHLLEMFKTLKPADDLLFDYATNAPTLRVAQMMVAGA